MRVERYFSRPFIPTEASVQLRYSEYCFLRPVKNEVYLNNLSNSNSRKQSPSWKANSSSASHEIPHVSWNRQVHRCTQNSSPPVFIPS